MTMLVAGHETTAAVLTWTLYLVAENPHIADKIRQEVRPASPQARKHVPGVRPAHTP